MANKKKTWAEKLADNKGFPKILSFNPRFPCGKALLKSGAQPGDSVVLAPPSAVVAIIQTVPFGKLMTLSTICAQLAQQYGTKFCCPLTTGIFVMIAANAAAEAESDLPYWRIIKNNGELNEKFPGGATSQKNRLEKEGHTIITKGKKHFIEDLDRID
jgi:alkylated DNA nucleotide flippase Atl1